MLDLTTPLNNAVDLIWGMFATPVYFSTGKPTDADYSVLGIITTGAAPWSYTGVDAGVAINTTPQLYLKKGAEVSEGMYCMSKTSSGFSLVYKVGVVSKVKVPAGDEIVYVADLTEVTFDI